MSQNAVQRICGMLFFLGMANFAAFFIVAMILGGDAVNGKIKDGHYYLSNHGHLKEVSRGIWLYSRAHVYSVFITHPLAIFAGFVDSSIRKPEKKAAV